tara:strand:- start:998 stop:1543 length:546 start_codon:yes stop_codon:yes gene_type:complete
MHFIKYKKYFFIESFNPQKLKLLKKDISLIWRSKHNPENIDEIRKTAIFCKKYGRKFFLANNVKLALNLKLNGAYISAYNRSCRFNNFIFHKDFKLIGSVHNLKDLKFKQNQNVKEIFISPIFKKKYNQALGIHKLNSLFDNFKGNKIALGGINSNNLKLIKLKNFSGFGGIEYFAKKKGP